MRQQVRGSSARERRDAKSKFLGCGILSAALIPVATVAFGPSLAIICVTLAVECLLGAIYAGRVL